MPELPEVETIRRQLAPLVEGRTLTRLEIDVHLLLHLRMTGSMLYDPEPETPYRRVIFAFDDGHELWFCDPRRFGTGELALGDEAREAFFAPRLGLEPLSEEFT